MGMFMTAFMVMLLLIIISPKQDAKERGFVACTQNLLDDLIDCNHNVVCSTLAIVDNTWCDIKVIVKGAKEWIQGQQPKPWSNYIYEPEMSENQFVDEEARQKYLKRYPNTKEEMEKKHLLRKELENEQNAIKIDEINWNENK